MTNTAAAEKTAGDKEKVEKRRALGRGLESLLPGPRAVGGAPGQSGGASGKQQVPFDSTSPSGAAPLRAGSHFVRNDKAILNDTALQTEVSAQDPPRGEAFSGTIRAVVEETEAPAAAELRSAGQPGAAVPTPAAPAAPGPQTSGEENRTLTIYAQAESR